MHTSVQCTCFVCISHVSSFSDLCVSTAMHSMLATASCEPALHHQTECVQVRHACMPCFVGRDTKKLASTWKCEACNDTASCGPDRFVSPKWVGRGDSCVP